MSGDCAKSCARSSCFLNRSGRGVGIGLLTEQLLSRDWGGRSVRFVRLALKFVVQNDGDFVEVIRKKFT